MTAGLPEVTASPANMLDPRFRLTVEPGMGSQSSPSADSYAVKLPPLPVTHTEVSGPVPGTLARVVVLPPAVARSRTVTFPAGVTNAP